MSGEHTPGGPRAAPDPAAGRNDNPVRAAGNPSPAHGISSPGDRGEAERTGPFPGTEPAREGEEGEGLEEAGAFEGPVPAPRLMGGAARGRRLVKPEAAAKERVSATPEQRVLLLDTWQRSGLTAGEFASMVGMSRHVLYSWKARFEEQGPMGLMDRPKGGPKGSRLAEVTKRAIVMMKEQHPEWGTERISALLLRGPALPASPSAVASVLHGEGYELEEKVTHPHEPKVTRFERAKPNELWQTDLFTFVLRRQNRRVYLIAFLDDQSRFVVGYGLHGTGTAAIVIEVFRAAVASYGRPEEVLTDNGPQYVTWRGKSAFTREMDKLSVRHIVASPRRPQTCGKVERFWGSLWRECVEGAVFLDLEDARRRVGLYIDHYNFQRPHQGIENLVPADRFFQAAPEVLRTLKGRVEANALKLAREGVPREPFYLTGRVGGQGVSLHADGERMILTREDGTRAEVELRPPGGGPGSEGGEAPAEGEGKADPSPSGGPDAKGGGEDPGAGAARIADLPKPLCPMGILREDFAEMGSEEPPAAGVSPLDEGLKRLREAFGSASSPTPSSSGDAGPASPAQGEAGLPAVRQAGKGGEA